MWVGLPYHNPGRQGFIRNNLPVVDKENSVTHRSIRFLFLALVALIALSVESKRADAQSSGATDPRFEKLAKDLYPKAKKEGSLVIYTIWDVEHIRSILAVFNKRFPDINTSYWQGTRSEIIARTLTEFQGDQKSTDVILSEGAPVVLRAAGAIEPYNTVQASALLLHDPTLPTVSLQIMALSYNTKKLKAEDLPKSWEDVINPKYKGMVALDDPLRAGPLSGLLAGMKEYWKDDARWTKYFSGLKALNVTLAQKHQRDVSPADCRRVFHRHAFAAARRGRRKRKGQSGGLREKRRADYFGAAVGYLRQGAAYQRRQAFRRVDDCAGGTAGGGRSGP